MESPRGGVATQDEVFCPTKVHSAAAGSTINSLYVCYTNVYQVFLVCAIKMVCYMRHLPRRDNQRFVLDVILDTIGYTNALVQRASSKKLARDDVILLGIHAFLHVLRRKQTHYSYVIEGLERKLRHIGRSSAGVVVVERVVDTHVTRLFCAGFIF